jgi:hypothetical protein
MKRFLLWCALAFATTAFGAASVADAQSTPTAGDFTGTWEGTIRVTPCIGGMLMRSGRCNAVNKIKLTLVQDGSSISGNYHCAIGTQICRNGNADDSGKITSGTASGNTVRFSVIVPADVSNCLYNAVSPSPGKLRGGYTCYQGGGIAEQGLFEASRLGG